MDMSERKVFVLFSCIVVLAFALRLGGVGWSLPLLWHGDEKTTVTRAMKVGKGNFDPEWFGYPNGPMMYGLGGVFRLAHTLAEYTVPDAVPPYEEAIAYKDGVWFYGLARFIMALLGACIVIIIYRIGRLTIGVAGSLFAAWFTAIQPLLIEQSHYITPDSLQTLFILCTVLWLLKWREREKSIALVMVGIFFGLAVATKYPSVIAWYFPLLFFLEKRTQGWKRVAARLAVVGGVGVLIFILTNPYFLFSLSTVAENLSTEARSNHPGIETFSFGGNVYFYLSTLWQRSSVLFTLFSLLSIVIAVIRREKMVLQIFLFVPIYYFFISFLNLHWIRWSTPIVPFLTLGLGWVLSLLLQFAHRHSFRWKRWGLHIGAWTIIVLTSVSMVTHALRVVTGFICRGLVKYTDERYSITSLEAWSFECPTRGKRKGYR